MGTTPHQHLLALRVTAAERMLLNPEMDLAEIAYAAGFSSQSHMTTAFGKLRGQTPGAYRSPFKTTPEFLVCLRSRLPQEEQSPRILDPTTKSATKAEVMPCVEHIQQK